MSVLFAPSLLGAQTCLETFVGTVVDGHTDEWVVDGQIYIEELNLETKTDSLGAFVFEGLCPDEYHVVVSRAGYEAREFHVDVPLEEPVKWNLHRTDEVLDDVVVQGKLKATTTQGAKKIDAQSIHDQAEKSLAQMLESVSGVSSLRNGSGISKPIVHGLYGNRVTILNNGVEQSGQQWGNDHSPEIDPQAAHEIKVIKGVSALEYPGANLGAVVLVEPGKIVQVPHLHGRVNYFFESNGVGNGVHLQLQQFSNTWGIKLNGTIRKNGDRKTPSYFLTNTGAEEANLALQFEKQCSDNWRIEAYLSTFNTQIGVLRGAHIGNLTDLEQAFGRDVPFFTQPQFSFEINPPRQVVHHHLAKLRTQYFFTDRQWIELTAALQINDRDEYDIRRSGRSDIPALSLLQYHYYGEALFQQKYEKKWKLKTGIQFTMINNVNQPGTGVFPLIPDYFQYEAGGFGILTKKWSKSLLEVGARYDYTNQNGIRFERRTISEAVLFTDMFHNGSASVGWTQILNESFSSSLNLGVAGRNPAINELYSQGLHQGVSGIEEGDLHLRSEQALKATWSVSGRSKERVSFEVLTYFQQIQNFIYLAPQDELRLTIRGSFPVFIYEQTNAQLLGIDFTGQVRIAKPLKFHVSYSYLRGHDVKQNVPLINMPPNRLTGKLVLEVQRELKCGKLHFENVELEANGRSVFRQDRLLKWQDYAPAPDAYFLLGARLGGEVQLGKTRLRINVRVENMLNTIYRDYLNRLRYFSDDLGINAILGVGLKF